MKIKEIKKVRNKTKKKKNYENKKIEIKQK